MENLLTSIDGVVGSGNNVISADGPTVISLVKSATKSGLSATFYLPQSQYDAVIDWYWTPERKRRYGLERVSDQEKGRIESDLGVSDAEILYSNRIPCPECGHVYGAFEFMQQGIRQHGREIAEVALKMNNACVLRVNPHQIPVCPNCDFVMSAEAHYYICAKYGCSRKEKEQ
ncbi:hypothetical protein [Streptomyces sp. JV184]|uniref:hypothetical protein n=1 Tax=Streptomyces sp. JV184 TaxID=858637 RepID=UPI002E77AE63|nr:hypothetical protein [Streptomyces sp. JV184]MEE1749222.1 hypothetical protein [Streptomyces sp. JV184]